MTFVGQLVDVIRRNRERWYLVVNISEQIMNVRLAINRYLNVKDFVKDFLAMPEDPIHIRQVGEDHAPFVFFPKNAAGDNGEHEQNGMIGHPEDAVKIRVRRVIRDLRQFVEESVRKKSNHGHNRHGQTPVFPNDGLLNKHPGNHVSRRLHVQIRRSMHIRQRLVKVNDLQLCRLQD